MWALRVLQALQWPPPSAKGGKVNAKGGKLNAKRSKLNAKLGEVSARPGARNARPTQLLNSPKWLKAAPLPTRSLLLQPKNHKRLQSKSLALSWSR